MKAHLTQRVALPLGVFYVLIGMFLAGWFVDGEWTRLLTLGACIAFFFTLGRLLQRWERRRNLGR
jgi:uncharacterized membrane protein